MNIRNRIFCHVFDWLCQHEHITGQKDLAKITKISENTLTNILNGKTQVSDKTLHKLNLGFNCMFNMQYLRGLDSLHMFIDEYMNDPVYSRVPYKENEKEKDVTPVSSEKENLIEKFDTTICRIQEEINNLNNEMEELKKIKEQLLTTTHNPYIYIQRDIRLKSVAESKVNI